MASINTIVKRKQYLWLGIVVVGTASAIGGALYLSDVDMSGNGETVAEQEPVPDMTGVVDTTFDDKVRQHATTEMQVTAAQMQKQYEEIRRELDVLNKQRGDDQRRIEKLGQDNAALAEQVKALGANPVTATGEPVPQMPAPPPGPEGEPQPGNTPVSFPPQGSVAVPPPTAFYPGNGVTPPPQVTYQSVPVPNRIQRKVFIDEAISREQLIPLDREKGLFTSGIHVLDELSVRALSRDIMKQNRVTVHPEKSVPRTAGYSDAVSVLAQDRPSLAIVSGQGGAAGQRERVAELVMMAREQGREVQIIAADRRSQMNLKQDERLSGELITGRRQLQEGMVFTPGSTVIVDQGEKLSLKETLTLLDGAARHNVQVLITDSGQRTGTGSALMAMKDAGVNTYRWQGGEQRPATIISEPDRNVRYDRLAGDFAASVKAGEESVAQVSGVREQAILTQAIRSELKTQGVLGHPEVTMTALSPVWLDSRSRYLRDMYRPGMVMEQWNPETRSHDRYVIDRVPDGKTEQAVREIAGQERDRADITEREAALPESVLRESQREQEAVREVARENLLQERLQQIERDMVRDLQKEKTLGGD